MLLAHLQIVVVKELLDLSQLRLLRHLLPVQGLDDRIAELFDLVPFSLRLLFGLDCLFGFIVFTEALSNGLLV